MEIMNRDSCSPGWAARAGAATMRHGAATPYAAPTGAASPRERSFPMNMQWQTPAAIDWRFGFEISLYVANR